MKHNLTNSELDSRISEQIHNAKYRDIMRMRLVDGLTYERIAEAVEMSPRQIANIVKRYTENCIISS